MAKAIITPTEAVKRELCARLKVKPAKVTAIHEAPRESFHPAGHDDSFLVRQRLGIQNEFLLFVGTLEPRKNLLTLVKAFAQILRETALRPQLVVAGGQGWLMDETFSAMCDEEIRAHLCLTGYLNDDELRALYSSCRAFIYPSLYEGFGLPPLEAMACGAPVIASRIPALQETLCRRRVPGAGDRHRGLAAPSSRSHKDTATSSAACQGCSTRDVFVAKGGELTREVYEDVLDDVARVRIRRI
jgi:glycosyltransferase involved in cell wall biosynthesis